MIPPPLTAALAIGADAAIAQALTKGATHLGQTTPTGEVGFVAAFVLAAVPAIAAAWRPVLQTHGLAVVEQGLDESSEGVSILAMSVRRVAPDESGQ